MSERYCPIVENEKMSAEDAPAPVGTPCTIVLKPAYDDDGVKIKPTIMEAEIIGIETPVDTSSGVYYNGVLGGQGDLMIFHNDDAGDNTAKMNNNGELEISTINDESSRYSKDGLDLIYDRE